MGEHSALLGILWRVLWSGGGFGFFVFEKAAQDFVEDLTDAIAHEAFEEVHAGFVEGAVDLEGDGASGLGVRWGEAVLKEAEHLALQELFREGEGQGQSELLVEVHRAFSGEGEATALSFEGLEAALFVGDGESGLDGVEAELGEFVNLEGLPDGLEEGETLEEAVLEGGLGGTGEGGGIAPTSLELERAVEKAGSLEGGGLEGHLGEVESLGASAEGDGPVAAPGFDFEVGSEGASARVCVDFGQNISSAGSLHGGFEGTEGDEFFEPSASDAEGALGIFLGDMDQIQISALDAKDDLALGINPFEGRVADPEVIGGKAGGGGVFGGAWVLGFRLGRLIACGFDKDEVGVFDADV